MVTLDELAAAVSSTEIAAEVTMILLSELTTAVGSAELAAEAAADARTPISRFPITINEPGSYYLTRGFNGTFLPAAAITLQTGNVTIDMNGFTLDARNHVTQPPQGINISGNFNVTIRNGTVRGFTNGVLANGGGDITLENLNLSDNVNTGANVTNQVRFISCRADDNGGIGLQGGGNSVAINCTAQSNGSAGIMLRFRSYIRGCRADFNTGDGIVAEDESLVIDNVCSRNGNAGDGAGIHVTGDGSRIEGNSVMLNDRGIDVDNDGNFIVRNSARDNGNASGIGDYSITGTQTIGEIISATGTISGAVSPWANFSF